MFRPRAKTLVVGAVILASAGLTAACTSTPSATATDQNATETLKGRLDKNQPNPNPDWSQYKQTLIDVENAQITGVATTTFFFNLGSNTPIKVCPSIGYPVPSTAQLSSPDKLVGGVNQQGTVAQMEPNGVFTGESSGTYVVCVAKDGTKSPSYWEGLVATEPGPAHFDKESQQIVLDKANVVANDQNSAPIPGR